MKIIRRGARADNGPSSIELKNTRISLEDETIVIRDSDIKDFVTKAHYNYRIELDFNEVALIIKSLGSYPKDRKNEIGSAFEKNLKELLRLVQSCVES